MRRSLPLLRSALLCATLGLALLAPIAVRGDDRPDHDFANDVDGALWAIDVQKLEWKRLGPIEVPAADGKPLDRPVLIDLASTPRLPVGDLGDGALPGEHHRPHEVGPRRRAPPRRRRTAGAGPAPATTRDGQVR